MKCYQKLSTCPFFKFIYLLFEGLAGEVGSQSVVLCEKVDESLYLRAAQIIKRVLIREMFFESIATDIPFVCTLSGDQSKTEFL